MTRVLNPHRFARVNTPWMLSVPIRSPDVSRPTSPDVGSSRAGWQGWPLLWWAPAGSRRSARPPASRPARRDVTNSTIAARARRVRRARASPTLFSPRRATTVKGMGPTRAHRVKCSILRPASASNRIGYKGIRRAGLLPARPFGPVMRRLHLDHFGGTRPARSTEPAAVRSGFRLTPSPLSPGPWPGSASAPPDHSPH